MDFTQELKYAMFLEECAIQEERLITAIGEALSICECGTNKIYLLQEAGFLDKIKGSVGKMLEFLKKVFAKFVENMNSAFASEAAYVEKYKDIILHRRLMEQTFTMHRYDIGLKRIASEKIPPFDINEFKNGADSIYVNDESFQKVLLKSDANFNGSNDFADECKAFFMGSDDEEDVSSAQINMTNIYNTCKDKNIIINNITRDRDALVQAANNAINQIDRYGREQLSKIQAERRNAQAQAQAQTQTQQTTPPPTNNPPANNPSSTQGGQQSQQQVTHNSYIQNLNSEFPIYESTLYNSILEISTSATKAEVKQQAQSAGNTTTSGVSGTSTAGANGLASATKSRTVKDVKASDDDTKTIGQTLGQGANSDAKDKDDDEQNKIFNEFMEGLNKQLNTYISNCNLFIAAKCTALDACVKDYMFILHTHVKQQLSMASNPQANQSTQAGTNYNTTVPNQQPTQNQQNTSQQPPAQHVNKVTPIRKK